MSYVQHTRQGAAAGGTGARPLSAAARSVDQMLAEHEQSARRAPRVTRAMALRLVDQVRQLLGLSDAEANTYKEIISKTYEQDWEDGNTPRAWPGNRYLAEKAGKSVSTIKNRIRKFFRLGLVRMHDSANGKRRGERDNAGRIVEAYGFDLSPLRARYPELMKLAETYDAEAQRFNMGRREIGRVRRVVGQLRAQAAEKGLTGSWWVEIDETFEAIADQAASAQAARDVARFDEAVAKLEPVDKRVAELYDEHLSTSKVDPRGSENAPHIQIQTEPHDSVHAQRDRSSVRSVSPSLTDPVPSGPSTTTIKIEPVEIAAMFPAAVGYARGRQPDWEDVCRSAAQLRGALGIRADTWIEASTRLGREGAAIALLITSEREARGEIRRTAGAYFAGMVEKARKGELDLAKTLWGFRAAGMTTQ